MEKIFFGPVALWCLSPKKLHFWDGEEHNQIFVTDEVGCAYVYSHDTWFLEELKRLGYQEVADPKEFEFIALKPVNSY